VITRRALLKSVAPGAVPLVRLANDPYDVTVQTVSANTVRILLLPRVPRLPGKRRAACQPDQG
jgi:hypothetical protein